MIPVVTGGALPLGDLAASLLYEAGCSDAAVETGEARTLADALLTAIRDIEKVPGLRAIGVHCENIVSLADIAGRAGVSREAARLWSTGRRGPGGFPDAVVASPRTGEKGWDWLQVAAWLEHYRHADRIDMDEVHDFRVLIMANHVLAARYALESEPDETVREEFERLLATA
jgi:hypothetical protein